ncbi:hypothetical protein [Actinophytocola oryzae]|uniref:Uncharacterized protein n=1 Tax=Actinophytocola oryzae TaxID=502181 RepID=A0A4R7W1N4_9PSEU|nr:hypothetical protein [Actinophytocola oryzae]TDV56480.1 hypothetical protein CLV71_102547 [Actinophytocola oryzae]
MLLREGHLRSAVARLDEAVAGLRVHGAAGINYEVGSLADQLPEIRAWLGTLTGDPDWARYFYNAYVEFALALAAALPAGDTEGVERTADGWHVASGRPVIWFGDARFDADLTLDGPLVVLGDLTVDGLLSDGDVDRSFLVVTGKLRTRALLSGAFDLVLGDLHADVVVCFNNDGGLGVGGDLVTELFVQDDHSYEVTGAMRVRLPVLDWPADDTELDPVTAADAAAWLPPGYLADDELDTWRILRETAAGHSPLLAEPRH